MEKSCLRVFISAAVSNSFIQCSYSFSRHLSDLNNSQSDDMIEHDFQVRCCAYWRF